MGPSEPRVTTKQNHISTYRNGLKTKKVNLQDTLAVYLKKTIIRLVIKRF